MDHYDDHRPHRAGADSGLGEMADHFADMNGVSAQRERSDAFWRVAKQIGTPPWWVWPFLVAILFAVANLMLERPWF